MDFHQFLDIARRTRPFLSFGGRAFATVPAQAPGCLSLPIRSRAFRQWFYDQCYSAFDTIPSAQTFAAILHHLDAQAGRDPQTCNIRVPFRVGSASPTEFLLDLANPSGEFVEITPTGWRIRSGPDFPFQTSPSTISLPTPEPPAANPDPLDSLRATLNLGPPNGPSWLRTLAWLLASLRPPGPYPILVLRGPANSGKSFAGLVLRTLIDPSACPYSPLPATVRELLTFARQNWILAFDHVQTLTPTVAAALCRLASGTGLPCREPGQPEPLQLWTRRPILLIAAPGWTLPPDLAARALTVDLPPLATCRPETELSAAIELALPQLLGALCDAVSHSLANHPAPDRSSTRHAGALACAQAAFPNLANEFRDALCIPPPTDPLVDSIRTLLTPSPHWTGTADELIKLVPVAPTPSHLSKKLRESIVSLTDAGIDIRFHSLHGGVRRIELSPSPGLLESVQTTQRKGFSEINHDITQVALPSPENRMSKH